MGIKIGFAALANKLGLFIFLSENSQEYLYSLAEVKLFKEVKGHVRQSGKVRREKESFYLLYPDGTVSLLSRYVTCQLKPIEKETYSFPWVSTERQVMALQGVLPKKEIMFDGEYQIIEISEADIYAKERRVNPRDPYENPKGIWNKVVAKYLA